MISSLANLADRNFVVGFLLPTIIATLVFLSTFQDIEAIGAVWSLIVDADKFATLTLLLIALWSLAVLLLVINIFLYRILEGYVGPFNSERTKNKSKGAFEAAKKYKDKLRDKAKPLPLDSPETAEYTAAFQDFRRRFPYRIDLVLPTRFGNVIRAFEMYSFQVYGIDSIPGWYRLVAVIPDSFRLVIDNARAEVDCFVNLVFLFAMIGLLCLARFFGDLIFAATHGNIVFHGMDWGTLVVSVACLLFSWVAYELAVYRAQSWGDVVRSAFDLYLPALATQLGYGLPDTKSDRKTFWDAINRMFLYGTAIDPQVWPPLKRSHSSSADQNDECAAATRLLRLFRHRSK